MTEKSENVIKEIESLSTDTLKENDTDTLDQLDILEITLKTTEDQVEKALHEREQFKDTLLLLPGLAFTDSAKQFNHYMDRADVFVKKAASLKKQAEEVMDKIRSNINSLLPYDSELAELEKLIHRIQRTSLNSYRNSTEALVIEVDLLSAVNRGLGAE